MLFLDITAEKEYSYTYKDGVVLTATEYDVTLNTDNNIIGRTLVNTIRYTYDRDGNLTKKHTSATNQTVYFETPEDGSPIMRFAVRERNIINHSKTDSFGRKVFEELQLGKGFVSRQFMYHAGEITDEHAENGKVKSSPVCHLVSQIVLSDERTLTYEYDNEERITKVIDSLDGEWVYTYDALGQLLTEQHKAVGAESYTTVNEMTYDNYGNILSKNGVTYTYGNSKWKDLLTKVGDSTITYDAQGNPTSYLGHTLTWEKGRQLKKLTKPDGKVITYTYNANGIRTSKTVNGNRHEYVLDGTKILYEGWNDYDETIDRYRSFIIPLYDNEDSVCGIIYTAAPYYFLKNQQGDVIALTDKDGVVVANYTYDAWGKVTSITGEQAIIASINPFRYRGYYYDIETGLYYLQSRYYDPETGRFINADRMLGANNDLTSYDLYAYCGNCPIDRYDVDGLFWSKIKTGLQSFLKKANKKLLSWGVDTAAVGAAFLNMRKDKNGIYHANFDCWQQYFGYNDLYDFMFALGTSMASKKFEFLYNRVKYILWAWKGDYINLGAGAELGIYYGGGPHWRVDKKLAMNMSMELKLNGRKIISYSAKTWWITGFNPNYLSVKASKLKASFTVKFNNSGMYRSFRNVWNRKWVCKDKNMTASYSF